MANEQIRKAGSFGGKKFKNLQRDRQHDNGHIQSIPAAPELHSDSGAIDVNQRFLVSESNFC